MPEGECIKQINKRWLIARKCATHFKSSVSFSIKWPIISVSSLPAVRKTNNYLLSKRFDFDMEFEVGNFQEPSMVCVVPHFLTPSTFEHLVR